MSLVTKFKVASVAGLLAAGLSMGGCNAEDNVYSFNHAPNVQAGDDKSALEGSTVALSGVASDRDGAIKTIQWQHTDSAGNPKANPILIEDADKLEASFKAPGVSQDQIAFFTLKATDDRGATGSDTVRVLIRDDLNNQPPVADAGLDQEVDPQSTVTLDGSGSTDPDGQALTYDWAQTAGEPVLLSDKTAIQPTFSSPAVSEDETLTFRLEVTDTGGLSSTSSVDIQVLVNGANKAPVAVAKAEPGVAESGEPVALLGSDSSDPDGDAPLTFFWEQTVGTTADIDDPDLADTGFVAPEVAESETLGFTLTVSDPKGLSDTVDVEVVVSPAAQVPTGCQPDAFDPQQCATEFCNSFPQGGSECNAFADALVGCGEAQDPSCIADACEMTIGQYDPLACAVFSNPMGVIDTLSNMATE